MLGKTDRKTSFELGPGGHAEKLISGIAAFIGILCVLGLSSLFLSDAGLPLVVASMGASAVLLFAVPHGPLSQPWPLIGSHAISAFIGVTVTRFCHYPLVASGLAVGLAIIVMYYLGCIHPPGGATALTAVLGGSQIHDLGYLFVLLPVLLNTSILLLTAIALNWFFPWRRYPTFLQPHPVTKPIDPAISPEHLSYALKQMGSFIDVTEEDLAEIYELARQHAQGSHLQPEQIKLGGCYSNGATGAALCIRHVVDESPDGQIVIFRTVAGENRRRAESCTKAAFALWAKEIVPPREKTIITEKL
ncbi:MAG TPA: HPP family protein [Verrucomicrobiae bacterium]